MAFEISVLQFFVVHFTWWRTEADKAHCGKLAFEGGEQSWLLDCGDGAILVFPAFKAAQYDGFLGEIDHHTGSECGDDLAGAQGEICHIR